MFGDSILEAALGGVVFAAYVAGLLRLRQVLRDRRGHDAEALEDENRRLRDELARRGN